MSNINNQAKNEVHELLGELVVSPISDNLKKQLEEMQDKLSALDDISTKIDPIKGLIQNLPRKLSDALGEKLDEVSSNTNACELKVKEVKNKLEKHSQTVEDHQNQSLQLLKKLDENLEDEKQSRNQNQDSLTAKYDELKDLLEKLKKDFEEEKQSSNKNLDSINDVNSKCAELKNLLVNSLVELNKDLEEERQNFNNDLNSINDKCDELKKRLVKSDEQLENDKNSISDQIQNLSQSFDNKAQTLTNSIDGISVVFKDKGQEISEEHIQMYKQNKIMFIIVIVLSVINLLGLIGVIIFYLFYNHLLVI